MPTAIERQSRGVVVEATMDTSVALVQAYLHVNGYFTVAEYPVLEAFRGEYARSVTDLDILAFRFAGLVTTSFAGAGTALSLVECSQPIRFLAARLIGRT